MHKKVMFHNQNLHSLEGCHETSQANAIGDNVLLTSKVTLADFELTPLP